MIIQNEQQLEEMKKIGAIVANCLALTKAKARAGMSTRELDEIAAEFLKAHGAISAPISCYKFPGHTCISVEKAAAHGIPGDTILKDGDLINIDVSAHLNGFFADNGESFIVGGKGTKTKQKLIKAVREALDAAVSKAQAGALISDLGSAVETVARKHKFTIIQNLGGHGIGKTLHDEPEFIASYFDKKDKRRLKEGTCLAVEPFLSNGGDWVEEADDGWTLYQDRFYAAQKEHSIVVTKKEPIILTIPTMNF